MGTLQRTAASFPVWPQHLSAPESITAVQQSLSTSCCLFVCSSIKGLQLLEATSPPSAGEEALGWHQPPSSCQSSSIHSSQHTSRCSAPAATF